MGKNDVSKLKLATTPMLLGRFKVKSKLGWEIKCLLYLPPLTELGLPNEGSKFLTPSYC